MHSNHSTTCTPPNWFRFLCAAGLWRQQEGSGFKPTDLSGESELPVGMNVSVNGCLPWWTNQGVPNLTQTQCPSFTRPIDLTHFTKLHQILYHGHVGPYWAWYLCWFDIFDNNMGNLFYLHLKYSEFCMHLTYMCELTGNCTIEIGPAGGNASFCLAFMAASGELILRSGLLHYYWHFMLNLHNLELVLVSSHILWLIKGWSHLPWQLFVSNRIIRSLQPVLKELINQPEGSVKYISHLIQETVVYDF